MTLQTRPPEDPPDPGPWNEHPDYIDALDGLDLAIQTLREAGGKDLAAALDSMVRGYSLLRFCLKDEWHAWKRGRDAYDRDERLHDRRGGR